MLFCNAHKRQVMSGTHRDLFFLSKSRSIASKNHTWGLEPMETSNSWCYSRSQLCSAQNGRWNLGHIEICYSGPKVRCFACKNHRWGLGHIGTSDSGANHAVFHAQNDRLCLGLTETCYSGPKVAAIASKTHTWVLGHIDTSNSDANHAVLHAQNHRWGSGTHIDLAILVQKHVVMCMLKVQMRTGTHTDL